MFKERVHKKKVRYKDPFEVNTVYTNTYYDPFVILVTYKNHTFKEANTLYTILLNRLSRRRVKIEKRRTLSEIRM